MVRWIRIVNGVKEIVKPAKGGGFRFVTFSPDEGEPTFSMMLLKALQLYFINDVNHFGEKSWEVEGFILDSAEIEVDLSESITSYMKSRGLFPSRIWFYLATKSVISSLFDESDDDIKAIVSPAKRKLCCNCSHTYTGNECIICQQNEDFQTSLEKDKNNDQLVEKSNAGSSEEEEVTNEEPLPSLGSLRQLRLKAILKNERSSLSSLQEELEGSTEKFMNSKKYCKFTIRRKCLYEDMLSKMKVFFSDADASLCRIDVEFISFAAIESCVDTGGPGRELFSLLFEKAIGKILHGPTKRYSFIHDLTRLENMEYFCFGQAIGLSLLSGYVAPHLFCSGLASYILESPKCCCVPEDVPDAEIKEKLVAIKDCNSELEFRTLLSGFTERFDLGYLQTNVTLKDKYDLLKKVSHHCIISVNLQEIQQFCHGLESGGVLALLRKYSNEAKQIFEYAEENIDVNVLKRNLKPVFSDLSSQASTEEDIVYNLHKFIDEVSLGKIKPVKINSVSDIEEGVKEIGYTEKKITLKDVVMFLTGSPFTDNATETTIYFKHQVGRLTVSTCHSEITIPVCDRYSSDKFSDNMRDDIVDSPGFGRV